MANEPVKYRMNNRVGKHLVAIVGGGTLSPEGLLSLKLKLSAYPTGWNAIVVPCICSGPGPGPKPTPKKRSPLARGMICLSPGGYQTEPGTFRKAILWDSKGEPVVKVKATGIYKRDSDGLDFLINVDTTIIKPKILSSLEKIDHYSFTITPRGKNAVDVFANYSLSGRRATKVYGCTRIAYQYLGTGTELTDELCGFNIINLQQTKKGMTYQSQQRITEAPGLT